MLDDGETLTLAVGRLVAADGVHEVFHELVEEGGVPIRGGLRGGAVGGCELRDDQPRIRAPLHVPCKSVSTRTKRNVAGSQLEVWRQWVQGWQRSAAAATDRREADV